MELGMGEVKPPRSVAGVVRGRKKMTESHVAVGRHYSRAGIEPCTRFEASFDRESSETDGSPPTETAGLEDSQYLTQAVLDEIGDLPLELQPKILRVIQERQFERPGGAATIHTDVRVVCATHRNLAEMIEDQEFRADLFYRLSVFPIELPPLRERPEDIRLLVQHFAMDYAARARKSITGISDDFMAALSRHPWPGNVRELQNFIERSVILSKGPVLDGPQSELNYAIRASTPVTLEEAQRSHILRMLQQTDGVIGGPNGAAARLGLPRTTLIARMKRLGL